MSNKKKLRCTKHGNEIMLSNFYIASDSSIFSGIGYIPICKNCIWKMVENYYEVHKDMKLAVYYMCRKIDVAFSSNVFDGALKAGGNVREVFQSYMRQYNSLGQENGLQLSFDDGEHVSGADSDKKENDKEVVNDEESNIKMTEEDKRIKEDVIRLLEYDPFEGHSEADQKFLYNDLYSYFGDEDVVEDQFLVSQIIQIVNNNNQIRKINYLISKYTANIKLLAKNESKIKSLNSIKKDIAASTDRIARSNSIAVDKRKSSNIKKSSLTAMMEYLRSLDFEDAEVDFYDQKKAYGMQRAADISMKAMAEQIKFDENDVNEIIIEQRNMIRDMENRILDLEEENRQLYVKIEELKANKN